MSDVPSCGCRSPPCSFVLSIIQSACVFFNINLSSSRNLLPRSPRSISVFACLRVFQAQFLGPTFYSCVFIVLLCSISLLHEGRRGTPKLEAPPSFTTFHLPPSSPCHLFSFKLSPPQTISKLASNALPPGQTHRSSPPQNFRSPKLLSRPRRARRSHSRRRRRLLYQCLLFPRIPAIPFPLRGETIVRVLRISVDHTLPH